MIPLTPYKLAVGEKNTYVWIRDRKLRKFKFTFLNEDMYGLPVTNATEASMEGINDFIHGFIAFESKATNVMGAAAHAPDFCLLTTYAAMLWVLL